VRFLGVVLTLLLKIEKEVELKETSKIVWAILLTVGITACGGGGGSSAPTAGGAGGAGGAVSIPTGIWTGTIHSNPINTNYQTIGYVSPSGTVFFAADWGAVYKGIATEAGTTLSGKLTGYAPPTMTFLNGSNTTTVTLSGTDSATNINGTYSAPADTGTFNLTLNTTLYNRAVTLLNLARTWTGMIAGATLTLTVSNNGTVTGSDNFGCQYTGSVSQLTANKNLFSISITSSVCGTASTFSGLGALFDTPPGTNNRFGIALQDGANGIAGYLQ